MRRSSSLKIETHWKMPLKSNSRAALISSWIYLWGQSAESLLIAGSRAGTDAPIRFIQIGTASGAKITLSGAILRSIPIELKGSGLGSIPVNRIVRGIEELFHAAVAGRFEIATKLVPLSEIERVWSSDAYMPRVVFTIGDQHQVISDG